MLRKHQLLFILFLILFAGDSFSQQVPFVYYTPKNGLINSRVRSIKQDSKGRMYFITHGGLSVYDGARFNNYSQQDGLANELVNDLVEITPDSLLIATNTSQLNTLVRGKVGIYKTTDNFCPVVNRFLKSQDGDWYVSADDGLYKIFENKFIRLPFIDETGKNIGLNLDRVIEWQNFFLIIPWNTEQKEKLILYDKVNLRVRDVYVQQRVFDVAKDDKDQVWVTTSEGVRTLDLSALQDGKIKLQSLPLELKYISDFKNSNILFDDEGNTWLYSSDQIMFISNEQKLQVISPRQGLRAAGLINIFVDREGSTWMGYDGNGVAKMTGTNIILLNDLLPGINSSISAIHQQRDTTWMFNAGNNTVYRYTNNELKSFPYKGNINKVSNIYTSAQSLYISDVKTVYLIRNKDEQSYYNKPENIQMDSIQYIGNGIIDGNGAIIQNVKQNDTLFYISVLYKNSIVMQHQVSFTIDQMSIDRHGRLWAATRDDHLLVFTLHPEEPSRYLRLYKDFYNELPEMGTRSMTTDKKGNVWIGTRYNGLFLLEFNDMKIGYFKQFTTKQGLTDNFIYRLYCDYKNNIWVGTQTGLDKVSLKDSQYIIENVTKSKNLFQTSHKIINFEDDILWALNSDGTIIKVAPSFQKRQTHAPPLLLTEVLVNDNEYTDSSHNFSHRLNNFTFRVAAASFIDEESIRYSYSLHGSGNNKWSEPSRTSTFDFINLSPGSYELIVKADFPASHYPPQMLSYSFTIQPPFWQTWWFRILSALLVIGLIYFIVRAYYLRILERKQMQYEKKEALEKERSRIALDMHDDLGAGLSKIRFLSETVQRNITQEIHQPTLQNIATSSVELVDKFNEIIWAMNEKNNSLEDLLYYIRSYTAKYCAENGLEYKIIIPEFIPAIMISGEMRRHIFLTVKECLHNVVKHAEARNVRLQFELDHFITITLHDDGKGFEIIEKKNVGNGLRSMEQRIKNLNGKILIENKTGTLFKIIVPVPVS